MNIKESLKQMVGDRSFWAAWAVIALLLVVIVVTAAVYVRPSDLQIPVRYTGFGITHFYRDKWFYEVLFVLFAFAVAGFHTLISAKLLQIKGREFALGFLWLTAIVLTVSAVFILAILRVAALS